MTYQHMHVQLCDLYENDCIFDKFDCALSGKGDHFATGTYNNFFRVLDRQQGAGDIFLEASRDPLRRRLATPTRVSWQYSPSSPHSLVLSRSALESNQA